jgi:hypothetical protein
MSQHDVGYLQHGTAPAPCRTESVSIRHEYRDLYQAWYEGRWRRIYDTGTRYYIIYRGEKITLNGWEA